MVEKVEIDDLFKSQAQTLINTVNCVGIMGKGIALEFKKRFPDMFDDYFSRCKRKEVKLGKPYLYKSAVGRWIINFPTKDDWRSLSHLDDILEGLDYIVDHYKEWGITSLAVPPLGMGSGRLKWENAAPFIYIKLNKLDIPTYLYAPQGTPSNYLSRDFLEGNVEISIDWPWYILLEILYRIQNERYHHPVGRTRFQKIAYIATLIGLPTGLEFQKASFGPYDPKIKEHTAALLSAKLITESDLGRLKEIRTGEAFNTKRQKYSSKIVEQESLIDKTADLFLRMNTNQSEITGTIIYSYNELKRSHKPSELDVFDEVMAWKKRHRPPLIEKEVADAIRNLAILGWLKVDYSENLPVSEAPEF